MRFFKVIVMGGLVLMALSGCSSTRGWYHLPTTEFDQIQYGYQVHTAEVRNISVGYLDEGQGEVVLLIHGLGSNAKAWQRNIPELAKTHRVIAVDLPGYGVSDKGYYQYSLAFYVQVLTELMDGLGIDQATWVGHSMGGQIAMVAALEQPARVTRLVLVSPAGFEKFTNGEGDWLKKVFTPDLVKETTIRNIAANLHSNFHATPAEAEFMITDRIQVRGAKDFPKYCFAVAENVVAMINEPVLERLGEITQPTLVLFGENDSLIPNRFLHGGYTAEVARAGTSQMPNARLVLLTECGHFAQFEKPLAFNAEVADFLTRK